MTSNLEKLEKIKSLIKHNISCTLEELSEANCENLTERGLVLQEILKIIEEKTCY